MGSVLSLPVRKIVTMISSKESVKARNAALRSAVSVIYTEEVSLPLRASL
ncbi:MAG: hypothetical protein ACRENW_09190 [Thermodesulfobacteriota bacterium]